MKSHTFHIWNWFYLIILCCFVFAGNKMSTPQELPSGSNGTKWVIRLKNNITSNGSLYFNIIFEHLKISRYKMRLCVSWTIDGIVKIAIYNTYKKIVQYEWLWTQISSTVSTNCRTRISQCTLVVPAVEMVTITLTIPANDNNILQYLNVYVCGSDLEWASSGHSLCAFVRFVYEYFLHIWQQWTYIVANMFTVVI